MTITNTLTGILFSGKDTVRIPHNAISSIAKKVIHNETIVVITTVPGYYNIPEKIEFKLSEVSAPANMTYSQLVSTLNAYNLGYKVPQTLVATDGQNAFTFEKPFLGTNMRVTLDDAETKDYEITRVGTIKLKEGQEAGVRVSILNFE